MQKLNYFYHDKFTDLLKLECNLLNLANLCLQKPTDANFYPFTEGLKNLLEKIAGEGVDSGPFFVFACKAVVDKTFFR